MNLRRVAVLFLAEVRQGTRGFLFVMAVVVPLVISLVVSLLTGTLFSTKPRLGLVDLDHSTLAARLQSLDSLRVRLYAGPAQLRGAVAAGAVDMGLVLPEGLDAQVTGGQTARVEAYLWGESVLKDRAILGAALASQVREMAGQEVPLDIMTTPLGEGQALSWQARLLPFVVLMAILMGGSMVPASSLIAERQRRTLTAVVTTPASLEEVVLAKGLFGAVVSLLMGVLILLLNRAFGTQAGLLLLVLALGSLLAAAFGILLGLFTKDINSLFATMKAIGLLLCAPAIVYMVPAIPQWIGRIFPTYYMLEPVMEISQRGGGWAQIAPDAAVLAALLVAMVVAVVLAAQRAAQRETL